jgi:hypothetical protein
MNRRGSDRRGRPRFEIVGELWGTIETRATLTVCNLGPGGALVESPVALEPGSMHWLTAEVDGEPQLVQVRVRHVARGEGMAPHMAGVEFVARTPALEAFLNEHLNGAGGAASGQA